MFDFDKWAEGWPGLIPRERFFDITGFYSRGYMSNLDARGEGIPERVRIGKKIYYPKHAVVDFIKARCNHLVTAEGAENFEGGK